MNSRMKRVKLNVQKGSETAQMAWPVTQGRPFPDGELERGAPVRVVSPDGTPRPTQSSCLATWNKDLKYVKWLLIDFQLDPSQNGPEHVFLEYGPGADPPEHEHPVAVEREGRRIDIHTGPMSLSLRSGSPDFLSACRLKNSSGSRNVFRGRPGPYLYMVDAEGEVYDSWGGARPPSIAVEESGPLRACVCVRGYHAARNGLRLCPYVLRVHAFAGDSSLRFYHTLIFDQDPDRVEISEVGMDFPLDLGDSLRMAFGGEEKAHWASRWQTARFLQGSDIEYRVELDGKTFGKGERTRGWASLAGGRAAAVVAVRDCWQEYPKGLELSPDGIRVQIWPDSCDRNLVFSTPWKETAARFNATRDEETVKRILEENPTAPLNLKSFDCQNEKDLVWIEEMIEKYAPGRPASHNDTGTCDGTGAAKTTEFWVRFSEGLEDQEAERFGLCVQQPVIAPPSPEYTYRTGATHGMYFAGDERFAEVDAALDDIVDLVVVEPRQRGRRYGMMEYGNLLCSHSAGPAVAYRHYYHTDPVKGLRHVGPYNNEANDQVWSLWGNFVRTARRDHFLLASAYSQAMADVSICHAHPWDPNAVGLMHYHNAHQWTGGYSPSHTMTLGVMLHYYFTGNRRLLDVALEVADWAVRTQEPAGIISCRGANLGREYTGPLTCVIEAYQATWKEQYGDLARRSLNWLLRIQPRPGFIHNVLSTKGERGDEAWVDPGEAPLGHGGGTMHTIFAEGLRLFDSEMLRRTVIAKADYTIWQTPTDNFFTLEMAREWLTPRSKLWPVDDKWYWTSGWSFGRLAIVVSLAYQLTGDPLYAAWAKYHVLSYFLFQADRIRAMCSFRFTWVSYGSHIPIVLATVAQAMEKDPEGLARAGEEWRRRRSEQGHPVYDGPLPGIPLDWDHFDANDNVLSMPPIQWEPAPRPPLPKGRTIGIPEGYDR